MTVAAFLLAGCTMRKNREEGRNTHPAPLPIPEIPQLITDPLAKVDYAALHFWEQLPDADSIDTGTFEQDVANFAAIASLAPEHTQKSAWAKLWQKRAKSLDDILPVIEDYLYDPESPVYSPDLLASAIDAADSLGLVKDESRMAMLRDEIRQNSPGTPIAGFSFTDRNGKNRNLTGNHNLRLLLIYDPECEHCAAEMEQIAQSIEIKNAITGDFDIVAIYPGGDFEGWKTHASELPEEWIVGMNRITPIGTLDGWTIRTTPQLYLIDDDDIVIWRGTTYSALMSFLALRGISLS